MEKHVKGLINSSVAARLLKITCSLTVGILLCMLLLPTVAYATVGSPNSDFVVNQIEAYRNVRELNDQLYLITGSVKYTAGTPTDYIDKTFLVRLMNGATELGVTTFYPTANNGHGYTGKLIASIYFTAATAPAWNGAYTVKIQGNPTLTWTAGTPPSVESSTFSTWYDTSNVAGTQETLTLRLRVVAQMLEDDWGTPTDLLETIAGVKKLTSEGEEYFTASIIDLRLTCPNLFATAMSQPDFEETILVRDKNLGGDDMASDIFGVNWYAETFTASQPYSIGSTELLMSRTGNPGTLTVGIRATAANLPVGADLATGTTDANTFTTNANGLWYEVSLTSEYALTYGTVYAIVVRAVAGGAANYVSWRSVTAGSYAGGRSCVSNDSSATWGATPPGTVDTIFAAKAFKGKSTSYRDRLAARLVGTRFDMTNLAHNFNMPRMWMSTLVWIIFACCLPGYFVCRASDSFKPMTMVFALMLPFGAIAGFVYLEIAILAAFAGAIMTVYVFWYRGSP